MRKRPTIHSVAALAGVSTATVSKVVNAIPTGMSPATRAKVEAAIESLGYRPDRMGRSLRTRRHNAVGMAIVDPSPRFLTDPFTSNIVAGLGNELSQNGFGLLLYGVRPGALGQSSLIRHSEVDAICLNAAGDPEQRRATTELAAGLGHPLVVIQDDPGAARADVCHVRQDDEGGAAMLAREVMRRRPARVVIVIAEIAWAAIEHRVAGFRGVFDPAGVAVEILRCDETSSEAITGAIAAHLDRTGAPDVILGQNDQIAIAALQVLAARGLEVPGDVAVTGFNAFPFTGFASPALTTVRSPAYELGRTAAMAILTRLETGAFASADHVLPLELVKGQSA